MGKEAKGRKGPELSDFPQLRQARELFIALFPDDSPFVNLGYTAKQTQIAKRVLSNLENEEANLQMIGTKASVSFHNQNGDDMVDLSQLRHGGYDLVGIHDYVWLVHGAASRLRALLLGPSVKFFEGEPNEFVAIIRMLPVTDGYNNIDLLVKHLYEGSEGSRQELNLEKKSIMTTIKSKIIPSTATFRAVWLDDQTKVELVVETDFESKIVGSRNKNIHVWRRLPEVELDGKKWTPFGRKPNASSEQTMQVLNAKRESVASGQLSFGKNSV